MTLYLVGGGLGPGYQTGVLRDILAFSEKVYVETYTVPGSGWLLEYARENARGKVVEADRSMLEESVRLIVEEARSANVAILVPGDPLIATTHRSIIAAAAEAGIDHRVVPGVSGVCAAKALSLLEYYKFGRTVTVPGPWTASKPYSVLGYIYDNACIGLHTLLLLDVSPEGEQLAPGRAAKILLELEEEAGLDALAGSSAIVVERAGYPEGRVKVYGELESLALEGASWSYPSSIVVPGELTPIDVEVIGRVHGVLHVRGVSRRAGCDSSRRLMEYLEV